ncbi:MAG: serine hydrolase [Marinilabiliaceae bacterium]|nr:serine hydrolase [Marinilabiliaceae bacterium]
MTKFYKRRCFQNILIFSLLLIGTWFLLPYYLREALTHWYPGIEDYQLFYNREVSVSKNHFEWPLAENYNQQELEASWRDTLENYQTTGFLVIQNDSIVHEEYWDHFGPQSPSNSFSAAKSIVSLLIGAAIDEGKIQSVDQKAGDFLPHFKKAPNNNLTIRHLLTMSSGSNWDEKYTSPLSLTTQAYYGNNLHELINKINITEPSGQQFSYKSGDTQILAHIVSAATNQSLSEYASKKLWQPLGARHPALWSLDRKNGQEKAYCCFNSNLRDFALIGALILHNGQWRGQQIISENYLQEAISPASHLRDESNVPVDFYGYQWWITSVDEHPVPYARGILGQYIFIIPHKHTIIVRLGNKRSKHYRNHHPKDVFSYLKMGLQLVK